MEKTIIAQLSVREENIVQFLKIAKVMVTESNAEKGCLSYKLLKEIDKQTEFVIYEKYANEKAIEQHASSTHYKTFLMTVVDLLLCEPKIDIY